MSFDIALKRVSTSCSRIRGVFIWRIGVSLGVPWPLEGGGWKLTHFAYFTISTWKAAFFVEPPSPRVSGEHVERQQRQPAFCRPLLGVLHQPARNAAALGLRLIAITKTWP